MDTLKRQFNNAIKREGKTITSYYKQEEFQCIFRRNSNTNSTEEHLTILYDVSNNIYQGQLLTYKDKHYLVLNQESIENDIYYKSSLLQCNLFLPVINNGVRLNIPCYIPDLTSPTVINGSVLSTLDGVGMILTESTDIINKISISGDTVYNILGGWFKVVNRYVKDNISRISIERTVQPNFTYSFELTSESDTFMVGESTTLTPIAKIDNIIDPTATITYESSDNTIATVNSNGVVQFISAGVTTITATWVEQNKTAVLSLTVKEEVVEENYTFKITTPLPLQLKLGSSKKFTPSLTDSNEIEQPFTAVWSFNYNGMAQSYFTITYSGNICTIKVSEDAWDLIDKNLTVIATTSDGKYTASVNVVIASGW